MRKVGAKSVKVLLVGLFSIIFGGCAGSLPSPQELHSEVETFELPKLPENGKAVVYVVRPSYFGGLIRFNVFIDDQEVDSEMGYTRGSQYIYFNLDPGHHYLYSKAENWADLELFVEAGDIVFIQQDPAFGFIMARNNLRMINNLDEGKYRVKTLSLGTILRSDHINANNISETDSTPALSREEIALKEKELKLREKELALKEKEFKKKSE